MKRPAALAFASAIVCAAPAVAADSTVAQLREMSLSDMLAIDIGTGTSKFLRQSPVVAQVITAEDIARMGARTLLEVLESVPGLNAHLFQEGVNSPIVDMRGSFTQRSGSVLFLRDGKPMRLLDNITMPEIFRLPVQFIERIEIARGPASALYGADALGGAINIITRKEPGEAGARLGTHEHYGAWAGGHGEAWGWQWALALQQTRHVDDTVTRNVQLRQVFTEEFRHEYGEMDFKVSHGGFSAKVWALNYGKDEYGDPANPRGETHIKTQHRHYEVAYARALSPTTQLSATAFHTRFSALRIGEVRGGVPQDDEPGEERSTAEVSVTESRFPNHRLRLLGGGFRERRFFVGSPPSGPLPPPGAPPPRSPLRDWREVLYAGIQDEFAFAPDWELTLGLRFDHYDDIGTVNNPRLGLVWNASPRLTAKLLAGEAFRAPPYGEAAIFGDKPERMRNVELAMDYRPDDRWSLVATAYRYRAEDLFTGSPTQLASRDGRGVEVLATWLPSRSLKLEASATWVDVEDGQGNPLPLTPGRMAKLAANWDLTERWALNARWEGYWDRKRAAVDPRPPLEDFNVAHLAVHFRATPALTVRGIVRNVLDDRSWLPLNGRSSQDFQLLERSFALQADYRF